MDRLERIELRRLEVPLRVPYKLAFGPVRHFDTMHVEVRDAAGAIGYGEATVLTGYTDETVEGAWANLRHWADEIAGLAPADAKARLLARVDEAPFAVTGLVSAIEMMQGDPHLEVAAPVDVPMLGLLNATEPDAIAREVDELVAKGFRTLKVKVGFEDVTDAARVRVIQGIVAGRVSLRLDGNQGYSTEHAVRFASGLDPAGIELLEQPCAAGDWDAACAVARVATVPMMVDESIYGLEDIRRTAELRCARFVKVKLMKFGSLGRLAEAIDLIRALGMDPVLGNGVACEVGCWMEAQVARGRITNAGEMNGYLKPARPLLENPPRFESGAMRLEPGYRPRFDAAALEAATRERHVAVPRTARTA